MHKKSQKCFFFVKIKLSSLEYDWTIMNQSNTKMKCIRTALYMFSTDNKLQNDFRYWTFMNQLDSKMRYICISLYTLSTYIISYTNDFLFDWFIIAQPYSSDDNIVLMKIIVIIMIPLSIIIFLTAFLFLMKYPLYF